MSIYTPWGFPNTVMELADGVTNYSTPGHGGIKLSPERWADFQQRFPGVKLFAGPMWFEEDIDWALVFVAFPELAESDSQLYDAICTIRQWLPEYLPLVPPEVIKRADAAK